MVRDFSAGGLNADSLLRRQQKESPLACVKRDLKAGHLRAVIVHRNGLAVSFVDLANLPHRRVKFDGRPSRVGKAVVVQQDSPAPVGVPIWSGGTAKAMRPAAVAVSISGVPSFIGLSLRDAVARARALGWMAEVEGFGYVTGQHPSPGAPAAPGKVLLLTLTSAVDAL